MACEPETCHRDLGFFIGAVKTIMILFSITESCLVASFGVFVHEELLGFRTVTTHKIDAKNHGSEYNA